MQWFRARAISSQLVHKYCRSGYLKALGGGAFLKTGDSLSWVAGVSALQHEKLAPVHIGARSALNLLGATHYLNASPNPVVDLVASKNIKLPVWLKSNDWKVDFNYKRSTLFSSPQLGLIVKNINGFDLKISSRERAILELIAFSDLSKSFELIESYMEGLRTIRSKNLQSLLENCSSIKVKRIFFYLAEKNELPVVNKLNLSTINFGTGKREIVKGGKLNTKFEITVPLEIEEMGL
jgi:hypothetical protein